MSRVIEAMERDWGGPVGVEIWAPSLARDERFCHWWANYLRLAASPGAAITVMKMNMEIDVRQVLPSVRVPTLIIHRAGDRVSRVEQARYLAAHIAGARLTELPGDDHVTYVNGDQIIDEVEEFLTGTRHEVEIDRVLATVLFTDIVDSTERAAELGDAEWHRVLSRHDDLVRAELGRWRGREVKQLGDGFLASFDGPARAIRCAQAITQGVRQLGLEVRTGIHTGECERRGDDLAGMAVHIGARVVAAAAAGEILVSSTVRDLVVGSGIEFAPRGERELKGVPGEWRLYAVA
jgi:class 3 adenylate cyclase